MIFLSTLRKLGAALGHGWAEIEWPYDDVKLDPEDAIHAIRALEGVYNAGASIPAGASAGFRAEGFNVVYESAGGRVFARASGALLFVQVRTSQGPWDLSLGAKGEVWSTGDPDLFDDEFWAERILAIEALLPEEMRRRARFALQLAYVQRNEA
jgi:hypothetical protein